MFNPFASTSDPMAELMREMRNAESAINSEKRITFDPQRVRKLVEEFHKTDAFQPGDVVQWKPGMKITRMPDYGERAVVVEMLDAPIRGSQTDGVYRAESYDMRLGCIDGEGDFITYLYDSRRFQKAS